MRSELNIGLVGFGTVGSGVAEILTRNAQLLQQRAGIPLRLKTIATRSPQKVLKAGFSKSQVTRDIAAVIQDPTIDVVVELIGGVTEAKQLVLAALQSKKSVVTANKALLATAAKELLNTAYKTKSNLLFEASVGGGIPILRSLREGFSANHIEALAAIINGTCNYLLTKMAEGQGDFQTILQEAQRLGYAEQDPSFDVDGIDAAHKLSILISLSYGVYIPLKQIYVEGIRRITPFDFECAKRFGFAIKLLAIAKKIKGQIQARVHPTMIPFSNPLASVQDVYNAVLLKGDAVGSSLLYGRGAGKLPTASAVVSDIVELARRINIEDAGCVPPYGVMAPQIKEVRPQSLDEIESEYYLRFSVIDRPGVLSQITGILGKQKISIASLYQPLKQEGQSVPIVIVTHRVREKQLKKAFQQIQRLKVVKEPPFLIRIEAD